MPISKSGIKDGKCWKWRRAHTLGRRVAVTVALVLGLTQVAFSQSRNTENTLKLDDPKFQPSATLEQVAWMVGSWEGKAFGGTCEEVWSVPTAGTMVGTFKLVHEGRPTMYEFEMVTEEKGSLIIKLKHFNADFTGWEEKDKFISFPLVKITEHSAYFDGLTYRRSGPDRLDVFLAVGKDDDFKEEKLGFRRMKKAP